MCAASQIYKWPSHRGQSNICLSYNVTIIRTTSIGQIIANFQSNLWTRMPSQQSERAQSNFPVSQSNMCTVGTTTTILIFRNQSLRYYFIYSLAARAISATSQKCAYQIKQWARPVKYERCQSNNERTMHLSPSRVVKSLWVVVVVVVMMLGLVLGHEGIGILPECWHLVRERVGGGERGWMWEEVRGMVIVGEERGWSEREVDWRRERNEEVGERGWMREHESDMDGWKLGRG